MIVVIEILGAALLLLVVLYGGQELYNRWKYGPNYRNVMKEDEK